MNWMLVGFSFQKSEIIFSQSCQEVILSTIEWNLLLNRQEKVFAIHSYNVALVIIYARFRQDIAEHCNVRFRQEYALLNLEPIENPMTSWALFRPDILEQWNIRFRQEYHDALLNLELIEKPTTSWAQLRPDIAFPARDSETLFLPTKRKVSCVNEL